MRRVPPELLRRIAAGEASTLTIPDLYFHSNPLIRRLFWARLERICAFCADEPAGAVLDLGCGGGELLPALAERFRTVVGLDLRPGLAAGLLRHYGLLNEVYERSGLASAASKNVHLVCGDLLRPPLRPASFDVVIAADVLEHLPDLAAALAGIRAVLRPGGALIISAPTENLLYRLGRLCFGFTKPADHYHSARQVEAASLRAGFQLARRSYLPWGPFEAFSAFVVVKLRGPGEL